MIEGKNTKFSIIDKDGKETELVNFVKHLRPSIQLFQERMLESFDLASGKDEAVTGIVIGAGNAGIKSIDVINRIQGFKGHIFIIDDPWSEKNKLIESFAGLNKSLVETISSLTSFNKALNPVITAEEKQNHPDGWYRKFENKRRWK